ncbi:tRNA lysidine(34) synthetase TilS [Candidatus Marimicrobium litorale]|uniref:tRNA(Ile)-lysidine synthase n=1 Tax=Candidatus Marimicrobium litorale TaxID=2518991 RepID=A0ABT3T1W7_9GAMM|nr:tRNA lysidine(34) synthetase TilS [Candidatus Marimicrobium litorale]MCX2975845.1 tRNA lysidine(34) synthetase TilS [Candidatus Marimicrobium litorale]
MIHSSELDIALSELSEAPRWLVGYSGGVDSTVLLHLLKHWCTLHPGAPALAALHVNHGLQCEADGWQQHCAEVCDVLEVPLITCSVQVPARGSEANAREARYGVFSANLQPGDVLFLAHHLDDQVETFFLRLMRGAGVEGLAGMPRQRQLGAGQLCRPLLGVSRENIEAYACRHNLAFVTDPSNSGAADRSFLRQQVLPLLSERWPAYRTSVARAAGHMQAVAALLPDAPTTVFSALGDPGIGLAELQEMGQGPARCIRAWLRAQGLQAPDQSQLQEFLRQLSEKAQDAHPRLDCGDYVLACFGDAVYRVPGFGVSAPTQPIALVPGEPCEVPGVGTVSLEPAAGEGLFVVPGERLNLGWRAGGEQCRLCRREGTRSLKRVLQDARIPHWWRDRVPLLYRDEELLAVGDFALCLSSRYRESAAGGEPLWQMRWRRPVTASSD